MTRTSVFLRDDQLASLEALSQRIKKPVADLIRNGIDRELSAHGVKRKREGP